MIVYFICFMFLLLFNIFSKNKKTFVFLTGMMLWGILALRSIEIGLYDTKTVYFSYFEMLEKMNFLEILKYRWMDDKIFYILMKIIKIIMNNYQVCIAILAIPFVYYTVKFIEKKSENPLLSFIVYIALYYMYGTFLLRQVIAIGIVLLSIDYIENKKFNKFFVIVCIAALFHRTAIIFLIAYPFARYNKFGIKNYIYIILTLFFAYIGDKFVIFFLKTFDFTNKIEFALNNNLYTVNGDISMFGLVITVCLLIFASYYRYLAIKRKNYDYKNDIYLNISTLGSMMYACSSIITEFYRVALYFSIINILLVSNFIIYEKNIYIKRAEKYLIILLFVIYFFTRTINNVNANPYMFFWQ